MFFQPLKELIVRDCVSRRGSFGILANNVLFLASASRLARLMGFGFADYIPANDMAGRFARAPRETGL